MEVLKASLNGSEIAQLVTHNFSINIKIKSEPFRSSLNIMNVVFCL